MRPRLSMVVLTLALGLSKVGNAQVFQGPTPPPAVTAANAPWQFRGDPVFFAGAFYYPTGPSVFFDGGVMVRSGVFDGVPLYTDRTLEPYSMVFVPVGGLVMRPYERLREGELAGTVGSRAPSFPIERDSDVDVATGTTGLVTPPPAEFEPLAIPEARRARRAPAAVDTADADALALPGLIESIPPSQSNDGIWREYRNARWYSDGPAVPFVRGQFEQIDLDRGFGVYRRVGGSTDADRIYVSMVPGGPLAPFRRR